MLLNEAALEKAYQVVKDESISRLAIAVAIEEYIKSCEIGAQIKKIDELAMAILKTNKHWLHQGIDPVGHK